MSDSSNQDNSFALPPHTHNGVDSPLIDSRANSSSFTLTGDVTGSGSSPVATTLATVNSSVGTWGSSSLIPVFTVNGKGLITGASNAVFVVSNVSVPILAGEFLNAGEVVCVKLGTGNNTTQGYNWVNGTAYAIRAAANNTTYGNNVLGIVTTGAAYLGTAQIGLVGDITGLSGLTAGSKHYLDNFSAASSQTITQATQTASIQAATTINQIYTPTSSRLDKIVLLLARNGGSPQVDVNIKRSNTIIATASATPTLSSPVEFTFDFTDVQCYKGELLNISVVLTTGFEVVYYHSGGSIYNGNLTGSGIPAGSDLYFKVFEFTNFGVLNVAAGTRKFKLGQALSSTELALSMQEADSQL